MALYYWVGGTNSWNATATGKWSNAPGGPVFYTTNPGVADDVFFDGLSGSVTVTLATAQTVGTINFTGFTGTFTFAANLTSGNTTLGASTTYLASGGNPTTYTFGTRTAVCFFKANGKKLPVNFADGTNGAQFTLDGDADFEGNYVANAINRNMKAATGTTANLRIGGNFAAGALTVNTTDFVTVRLYGGGTPAKTFVTGTAANNLRVVFVAGSNYTSSLTSNGTSGSSFLTVEANGRFNAQPTHYFANNNTVTVSGFNSSNNSDFFGYNQGTLVLATDTVIKSSLRTTGTMTIQSISGAKLLLEGNFETNTPTSAVNATTIDILEFSGTTTSTVSITSTTTFPLWIKQLTINKTGAGSVFFNPSNQTNPLILWTPGSNTSSWTHTSGTVTQSSNSVIRIQGASDTSQFDFSTSVPTFSFLNLQIAGGKINLNSTLICTRLLLSTLVNTTEFLSSSSFGFIVDRLTVTNSAAAVRTIILKSGVTYRVNLDLNMFGNLNASGISLRASLSNSTKAIFNLEPGGTQTVESISPTDIDSSGNNNVGPPVKETIYSLNGSLLRTFNWSIGSQPPPVGSKVTVGYTFVN